MYPGGVLCGVGSSPGARMTVRDKQPLERMLAGCTRSFAGADTAMAAAGESGGGDAESRFARRR